MPNSKDDPEREFKDFVQKLLQAQTYRFGEDEIFSPQTLREIFRRFCNIVADEVDAQSCSIHLHLYHPGRFANQDSKEGYSKRFEQDLEEYNGERRKAYGIDNAEADSKPKETISRWFKTDAFWRRRKRLLLSHWTFPYWRYPKGASILEASNRESELNPYPDEATRKYPLGVAQLWQGISREIYQSNIARHRDRLQIMASRDFRKLGGLDHEVWRNGELWRVFRDYYGVPIRLHSQGEVIGVLKVENKGAKWWTSQIEATFLALKNLTCEETFHIEWGACERSTQQAFDKKNYDLGKTNSKNYYASILWRAYLQLDGEIQELPADTSLLDFALIGFDTLDAKSDLIIPPRTSSRPPVQIYLNGLQEEWRFWEGIYGSPEITYAEALDFYRKFNKAVGRATKNKNKWSWLTLSNGSKFKLQLHVIRRKESVQDYAWDFELSCHKGFRWRVVAPPSPRAAKGEGDFFKAVNSEWIGVEQDRDLRRFRQEGELRLVMDESGPMRVVDLRLDRVSARTTALALALPKPRFSAEDSHKLSWAAFELGKLIEREISYRANYNEDPIPLTAMEFFRIPISGLNFVDDLRARHKRAFDVREHVDHLLKSLVGELGLSAQVMQSSRVKDYRSYLLRLGERYEGYVRGQVALWLYLLATVLNTESQPKSPVDVEYKEFIENLEEFQKEVDAMLDVVERAAEADGSGASKVASKIQWRPSRPVLADRQFNSSPVSWSLGNCRLAARALIANLHSEGLLKLPREVCNGELDTNEALNGLEALQDPHGGSSGVGEPENSGALASLSQLLQRALEDLVYRNYDAYARQASSLLIQLLGIIRYDVNYRDFYDGCRQLQRLLSRPFAENPEKPGESHLRHIFEDSRRVQRKTDEQEQHEGPATLRQKKGSVWSRLILSLENQSTREFLSTRRKVNGKKEEWRQLSPVFLTVEGLYKRARMLHHILRMQSSAASLERTLGRYDLVGTRLTCLFKQQVFLLGETIWNRGDPFFAYSQRPKQWSDYTSSTRSREPDRAQRQMPWFCVRAKRHAGQYNALQLATLVDPDLVFEKDRMRRTFTPAKLRIFTGLLFEAFEGRSADSDRAGSYRNVACWRQEAAKGYADWFRDAERYAQASGDQDDFEQFRFGSFLFEGVVDVLLELTRRLTEDHSVTVFAINVQELLTRMVDVVKEGRVYSRKVEELVPSGVAMPKWENCKEVDLLTSRNLDAEDLTQDLYKATLEVCTALDEQDEIRRYLSAEENFFKSALAEQSDDGTTGERKFGRQTVMLFYISQENSRNLEEDGDNLSASRDFGSKHWRAWHSWLRRVREEQVSFLLAERAGEGDQNDSLGLSIRSAENILGRIENHILLYHPRFFKRLACSIRSCEENYDEEEQLQDLQEQYFKNWTAYDLYYYFRSLTPVEVQIRTSLANTVAVQYYDALYKGRPPIGTYIQRRRIDASGSDVESFDGELELNYRDYLKRYYFANKKSTKKPTTKRKGENERNE